MALTKIFTGMELGPEAIDANFKALDVSSPKILTNWSSDGISYKNGCSEKTDDPNTPKIQYRLMQLGDSNFLSITGWFNVAPLDSGQKIVAFTLPISIVSQVNKSRLAIGRELSNWAGFLTSYDLVTQTGDFFVSNAAAGHRDATGLMVNYGTWA